MTENDKKKKMYDWKKRNSVERRKERKKHQTEMESEWVFGVFDGKMRKYTVPTKEIECGK